MKAVANIGLDIAKQVFQVHGADRAGNAVLRRKLKRSAYSGRCGPVIPLDVGH